MRVIRRYSPCGRRNLADLSLLGARLALAHRLLRAAWWVLSYAAMICAGRLPACTTWYRCRGAPGQDLRRAARHAMAAIGKQRSQPRTPRYYGQTLKPSLTRLRSFRVDTKRHRSGRLRRSILVRSRSLVTSEFCGDIGMVFTSHRSAGPEAPATLLCGAARRCCRAGTVLQVGQD
jgi:hypothetical protein